MMNPRPPHDASADIDLQRRWMREAGGGDHAAFVHIVAIFVDQIYNMVLRIVGEHEQAVEITQDTFVKAREKIRDYRGECAPYIWFLKISAAASISYLRKVQRRRGFSEAGQAAGLAGRVAEQPGKEQELLSALWRLDAEYRAVLVLSDVEDLNYEQIAEILGLSVKRLPIRLFRARLALHDGMAVLPRQQFLL